MEVAAGEGEPKLEVCSVTVMEIGSLDSQALWGYSNTLHVKLLALLKGLNWLGPRGFEMSSATLIRS